MSVVEAQRSGTTVVLTLNRPEVRNALNREMLTALGKELRAAESDETIMSVVISGGDCPAFCSGMDLRAFASGEGLGTGRETSDYGKFVRREFPKPVIAAVNGPAVAGGFELVLACDLVVASVDAKFGLPEAKRGLVAGGGGALLPLRLPVSLALEIGLTGDYISAARAHEIGLVNYVVPQRDVLAASLALASAIGANAPLAVRETKRIMNFVIASGGGDQGWEALSDASLRIAGTRDAKEGATAFSEHRPAVWEGR